MQRSCRLFSGYGVALFFALLCFAVPVWAAEEVQIANAWVRSTVAGQPVAAAYLELSAKRPLKWVEVSSSVAASGEIHNMLDEQGVMKMRAMDFLEVRPGEKVVLAPGAKHVMLFGLKEPLNAGTQVELKLRFVRANGTAFWRTIQAPVRDAETTSSHDGHEH